MRSDVQYPLRGITAPVISPRGFTLRRLLFGTSNATGFTFEPWDITTLFQDRAGTTPVTGAGQSVGLRLDKSQGLRIGPELVTNGDFASSSNWNPIGSNITITGGALVISGAANNSGYYQASTSYAGGAFEVVVVISSLAAGAVTATLGIPSPTGSNCFNMTAAGTYRFRQANFTADTNLRIYSVGASTTATIDSVSVKALAGNHEVAINDAARGVYGREPETGTRNRLTYTEQFDNAVWIKSGAIVTANQETNPLGSTVDADKVDATGASNGVYITSSGNVVSGVDATISVWVKSATGSNQTIRLRGQTASGTNVFSSAITVTNVWQRVSFTWTPSSTFPPTPGILTDASGTAFSVYLWGAQLETGSTATAYQRVVSQYDITEAGVASCYYVQTDGVDDACVTPTITPGTDKVQVFAGVRKNSDAATAILLEMSATIGANAGVVQLAAPITAAANYQFTSKGTVAANTSYTNSAVAAPNTSVLTGLGDISGDRATLRINGVQVAQSTADQGTGNYLAYPAYLYASGGTTLPFNGRDYGHAVRFGPTLDAATIARVEALIARNTPTVTL